VEEGADPAPTDSPASRAAAYAAACGANAYGKLLSSRTTQNLPDDTSSTFVLQAASADHPAGLHVLAELPGNDTLHVLSLKVGDIITHVDGHPVAELAAIPSDLWAALADFDSTWCIAPPDGPLSVNYQASSFSRSPSTSGEAPPRLPSRPGTKVCGETEVEQVTVTQAQLEAAEPYKARLLPHRAPDETYDGYRVSSIRRGSVFDLFGIRNGDIITHVNETATNDPRDSSALTEGLGRIADKAEPSPTIRVIRRECLVLLRFPQLTPAGK